MFSRNSRDIKNKVDVNHYTARRLGDMAESLNQLAKAFDDEVEKSGQLTRLDGLAAMQAASAICMLTVKRRTVITCITCCGHLSRKAALIMRTCPRCLRAGAGNRTPTWPSLTAAWDGLP